MVLIVTEEVLVVLQVILVIFQRFKVPLGDSRGHSCGQWALLRIQGSLGGY